MEHDVLERKNLHEDPFPSAASSHHFHMVPGVDVKAEPISQAATSDSGYDEQATEGRLIEMGFTDAAQNALLLQEFNGDIDKVIEKLTMEALPPPSAPVAAQAGEALAQKMAAALQSDSDAELAAKVQEQLKVEASSGGVGKGGLCKGPAKFTSSSMFWSDVKYCGQCGYGTTKPDRASCKQCASTQWLTTLDKARIEGANASLKRMIEVGVRRRGRQQDARAACASMQAVGVCDVRA
jgi:hypothetical protein